MAKEFKSGRQVVVSSNGWGGRGVGGATLPHTARLSDRDFNLMLRDPTIKLAVDVIVAMLMQQPWTIEGQDADICDFTWAQLEPYKEYIIRSSFRGLLKDGWRSFETRYDIEDVDFKGGKSRRQVLTGIKSLRTCLTDILVDDKTGDFLGVENTDRNGKKEIIDKDHVLWVNFDDEGYGDLGDPLLRVPQESWQKWNACDSGAQRYDDKVAGGFTWIQYPVGSTAITDGGPKIDHAELARRLGEAYKSAGYGATPVDTDPETGEIAESAWKMERVTDGGGLQPSFVVRLKYLDALKLRAFGIPERATTEGTFGTKAEAEAHADVAIIINLERHKRITQAVTTHILEPFNRSNWGKPGACRLLLGKLSPDDRALFSTIFTALMTDPVFGEQIAGQVDIQAMLEKLNVPVTQAEQFSEGPDDI